MSKGKALAYSPMESKLFALLKSGRKFTIKEMVERVYVEDYDAPTFAHESIYGTLHRLGAKIAFNREPKSLYKEENVKPRAALYWME